MQGHRLQIVVTGDLGLGLLRRAHQLGHGADERLREPLLLPPRLEPVVGSPLGQEIDRAGAPRRVVGPANGPLGDLGPFHAPLDAVIDPGEGVVDADGAQSVRVLRI